MRGSKEEEQNHRPDHGGEEVQSFDSCRSSRYFSPHWLSLELGAGSRVGAMQAMQCNLEFIL